MITLTSNTIETTRSRWREVCSAAVGGREKILANTIQELINGQPPGRIKVRFSEIDELVVIQMAARVGLFDLSTLKISEELFERGDK